MFVLQISDLPVDHRDDNPLVPIEAVDGLHFLLVQTGGFIHLMIFYRIWQINILFVCIK